MYFHDVLEIKQAWKSFSNYDLAKQLFLMPIQINSFGSSNFFRVD